MYVIETLEIYSIIILLISFFLYIENIKVIFLIS